VSGGTRQKEYTIVLPAQARQQADVHRQGLRTATVRTPLQHV